VSFHHSFVRSRVGGLDVSSCTTRCLGPFFFSTQGLRCCPPSLVFFYPPFAKKKIFFEGGGHSPLPLARRCRFNPRRAGFGYFVCFTPPIFRPFFLRVSVTPGPKESSFSAEMPVFTLKLRVRELVVFPFPRAPKILAPDCPRRRVFSSIKVCFLTFWVSCKAALPAPRRGPSFRI